MPCILLLVILFFPRVCLVLMWLFTHDLALAFPSYPLLLPLAGFIFMPLTTVVYAWMIAHHYILHGLAGTNLVIIIICVIIDVSGWGGGLRSRR